MGIFTSDGRDGHPLYHAKTPPLRLQKRCFDATRVCKPGSVLTAIYLALRSLARSSRLLEAVGQTYCFSTALLRDRVYSVLKVTMKKVLFAVLADLLRQFCTAKTLKYIKYSCGFAAGPDTKSLAIRSKIIFTWRPNPCYHGPGGLLPHLFTLAEADAGIHFSGISLLHLS